MSLQKALVAHLKGHCGLKSLIGDRVYRDFIPQHGTLPCVVYQLISSYRDYFLGESSTAVNPLFQITCWATDPGTAENMMEQVYAAIDQSGGQIGNGQETFNIIGCLSEGERSGYEKDTGYYFEQVDFRIRYESGAG